MTKDETKLKHRRALFWDIPEVNIEQALVESDEWVINRVFEFGTLNDIFEALDFYGESRIKVVLAHSKMGRITSAMAYLLLDLKELDAA